MTTLDVTTLPLELDLPPVAAMLELSIDQRIDHFAREHDGLLLAAAAEHLGISEKALRYRRDKGLLEVVHPHVYRCSGAPVTIRQQLRAACWTTRSLTVVSHRSAAAMWLPDLDLEPIVEVSMNRPHAPALAGVVLHRSSDIRDHHRTELDGLPITTMARTIVDLGAVVPWWIVESALESASSRRLVTISELVAIREELSKQGRRGVGVAGDILDRRGLGEVDTESVLEAKFAKLCREYEVPGLVYQHHVAVDGRDRYLDFAVPHLRLAFELKGFEHHSRLERFIDDCHRTNGLSLLGWTVIEFTWSDVVNRPGYVARVIREAIRQAEAALPAIARDVNGRSG